MTSTLKLRGDNPLAKHIMKNLGSGEVVIHNTKFFINSVSSSVPHNQFDGIRAIEITEPVERTFELTQVNEQKYFGKEIKMLELNLNKKLKKF